MKSWRSLFQIPISLHRACKVKMFFSSKWERRTHKYAIPLHRYHPVFEPPWRLPEGISGYVFATKQRNIHPLAHFRACKCTCKRSHIHHALRNNRVPYWLWTLSDRPAEGVCITLSSRMMKHRRRDLVSWELSWLLAGPAISCAVCKLSRTWGSGL